MKKMEKIEEIEIKEIEKMKGGKIRIFKPVFIALGFVFTALGCIGIPLPVLPTTPFLLLAAFCFAKGSRRVDNWFRGTKLYKNHLESFAQSRSMTLKTKLAVLLTASAMLLAAFAAMTVKAAEKGNTAANVTGRVFILCMIPVKYVYFFTRIKTIPSQKAEKCGKFGKGAAENDIAENI